MINKKYFGTKIAKLRKESGLSQVKLAERLGITSQAVSKWECGEALPDIELLLDLSHLYNVSINELLEDFDLIATLADGYVKKNGIYYFVPQRERKDNLEWALNLKKEKWIRRNWNSIWEAPDTSLIEVGERIARMGGTALEIGAGPGGGFMPYILRADPHATVIISDLSPTVIEEWKRFLDKELGSPDIHYAAMDFCDMPFKDNSIDIISDGGGIGNCVGDRRKALKEVHRVLKPGGMLITGTGFVTKETLSALSSDAQKILKEKRSDIFEDLYEDTVLAGFKKIDSVVSGCWYTDTDDSTIADLARSLGVNLKFTSYIRYCIKD